MNGITSIPSVELINPSEGSEATSLFQICVDIAVQHPYRFRGEVIAAGVPLRPLKETAPTLLEYLTIDGTEILLPRSEAVDWSLLLNLIDVIVDKHRSGEVFEIDTHEMLQDPVRSIKLHVILTMFGLHDQASSLLKQLWLGFETHTLTPTDVFWMYGALVLPKKPGWVPELTDVYLQMMAWNILDADAENRLHPDLHTFFLEEEAKPYHLTRLLEEHFHKYGLSREKITEGAAYRKRRDTATERTEVIASQRSSTNGASNPTAVEASIFPARWHPKTESKELQKLLDLEACFPDGSWDQVKWDGKGKNVKKMAAERDGLLSLWRSLLWKFREG
ncbi:hypothetical protein E8E12_003380 [Didymella heteroderae]|uniref:Uncharacterized protein n=1 Tax=Didymella heteroderae TaxID=1769908 RepID=A0A9P4WKT0_9PLEO|nr:hypothetical protein E8E12_003380 [Didymella heteroderae]